jgi:hypothetical protein
MTVSEAVGGRTLTPELVWMGDGTWAACDSSLPTDDSRYVLAYLVCRDRCVQVLWVGRGHDSCSYESLREAFQAVTATSARRADLVGEPA